MHLTFRPDPLRRYPRFRLLAGVAALALLIAALIGQNGVTSRPIIGSATKERNAPSMTLSTSRRWTEDP